jgi:glycosyltransferase involved in cell wall biosynthesis
MRFAYLSTDPGIPFGGTKGASVHVARVTKALAAEGCEVLVLMASVIPGCVPPPGVVVESLPGPSRRAGAAARVAFQGELSSWLAERLSDYDADAVYERLALHSAAGSVAARRLGIPHLVELNAPLPAEAARYRTLDEPAAAERLEADTLAGADAVLAVSPPLADYAVARGARRVEVLQNAADVVPTSPRDGRNGPPVGVFAGSLRPWHGVGTIAAAWRLLGHGAPPLLVVGDGPERPLLEGLDVRFTGAVDPPSVPALLAGADIGLAPYSPDTPRYFSPLKLFEYLAAGLATIVADLPAALEIVDDRSAVVIPAGDAQALAGAVAALRDDPSRRRELGAAGRALIEARHTWRHRARRIVALVDELRPVGAVP